MVIQEGKAMSDFESYEESSVIVEIDTHTRAEAMENFVDALSALLQSGIRMLFIGENLEDDALYMVCADQDMTFVQFLDIEMDDEGDLTTHTIEIKNEEFEDLYGLVAPVVIENCESFEDFLGKTGIQVTAE